ncbi:initiator tRNA phosphoribosyl transferase, partial [Leucogyrophana mollusca]
FQPRKAETQAFVELRKESQDIYNRVHSIAEDAAFVRQVQRAYPTLPLLPNMRCGAWYTDPDIASKQSAYFKSTDGHTNNWSFNLRRPNLHILPLILEHQGIVLVDSTRAGKRMPDALSKTVPIWCAVINRAILKMSSAPDLLAESWNRKLYTPPGVVSAQEHDQIESKLDAWADALVRSFYQLPELKLPLRPIWITPSSTAFPKLSPDQKRFYPIICVSASKQVVDGLERRNAGFAYIQGSGDDHELWSMGLTPGVFWKHRDEILRRTRSELPALIRSLVSLSPIAVDNPGEGAVLPIPITHVKGLISLCANADLPVHLSAASLLDDGGFASLHLVSAGSTLAIESNSSCQSRVMRVETAEGKKGQHHYLQTVLPQTMNFIQTQLGAGCKVCITCETGTDASIGVALAALSKFFDDRGQLISKDSEFVVPTIAIDKQMIKTRLQWIISSCPQANPSRTTLKRVNEFLLSSPCFR